MEEYCICLMCGSTVVFIPMFGFMSLLVALVMGMGALLTKIYTVF